MGKNDICLDTGMITLLYSKDTPQTILQLFSKIKESTIEAHILSPLIAEAFYHICKLSGKVAAETILATFLNNYPIKLVNLNQSLMIKAGLLKCQHANNLSYNDCFAIAYALNKKLTLHTTEKTFGTIFPTLKLKTYSF
ncbi:MAG: PIN domain-containing protein [Candidatus Lokiarchaeota archaeon]|nr:PIN domain-containing protein [Candidatus Lokiarchaeota archaeon]